MLYTEFNLYCLLYPLCVTSFVPTGFKGCWGIVFIHGVTIGRRAGGQVGQEKVCPGCISENVRCNKFILGKDIGWGM